MQQQSKQCIVYKLDELFKITLDWNNFKTFKILDPQAVKTVRRLCLNRWGWRGGKNKGPRNHIGINITNLSYVKLLTDKTGISNTIKFVVANVQSLKPKEAEVLDYLLV